MGKISILTVYEPLGKVKDALLAIIKNAYRVVTNIDGADEGVEIHHCSVEEPADGQPLRIVVHGQTDRRGVRILITFELAGKSAVNIVAEYPPDEPVLEGYVELIFAQLRPNRVDKTTAQVDGAKTASKLEDTTGWDTTLIEMWQQGHSRAEIALRVSVGKDRVTNRITELRKKFGVATVPYDRDRHRLPRRS